MKSVLVLFVCFIITACGDNNSPLPEVLYPAEVQFRPLLCPMQGGLTSIETAQQTIINDQNNYLHLVEISHFIEDPVFPDVDFETETVIAVNMGQQRSGGYKIEITAITEYENSVLVQFDSISRAATDEQGNFSCPQNNAYTSPYCIVAIPKIDKDIVFEANEYEQCRVTFG